MFVFILVTFPPFSVPVLRIAWAFYAVPFAYVIALVVVSAQKRRAANKKKKAGEK
jgi:hypothetical protein